MAQRVLLPSSDGCDKAKDVRLNEQIVAPVNTRKTLLIDITHSHCYRVEWAGSRFGPSNCSNSSQNRAFRTQLPLKRPLKS